MPGLFGFQSTPKDAAGHATDIVLPAPGPEDLVTAVAIQQEGLPADIGWKDLDLKKFVVWNCSLFVGIRCFIYPSALMKTRLQVQRHVWLQLETWVDLY